MLGKGSHDDLDTLLHEIEELLGTPGLRAGAREVVERAARVCAALGRGEVGIPPFFIDEAEPDAPHLRHARQARLDRSAVLQIAAVCVVRSFASEANGPAATGDALPQLMRRFAALGTPPPPPGVFPSRNTGNSGRTGGYAGSDAAKEFFEGPPVGESVESLEKPGESSKEPERPPQSLIRLLADLDKKYDATYRRLVAQPYDGADPQSVAAWSHAWSLSIAALASEWLWAAGGRSAVHMRNALLGSLPQFRGRSGRALPTDDSRMHVELWLRPLLCQVLSHNEEHWRPTEPHGCSMVDLPLYGLNRYESSGRTYYHGRVVSHLYLAVWLERMPLLLEAAGRGLPMNSEPQHELPDQLSRDISPGQVKNVERLINSARPPGPTGVSPPRPTWRAVRYLRPADTSQRAQSIPAGDVTYREAPPEDEQCLGAVQLPWDVDEDHRAQWLDLAFVVRRNGRWSALALDVEADEEERPEAPAYLSLWVVAPQDKELIAAVRNAMRNAVWVRRNEGFGVFIAGAVDLDSNDRTNG